MNRRAFVAGVGAWAGASFLPAAQGAGTRIGRGRMSAITDEIPMSPEEEYDQRFTNLAKCIQSAHAFECPYLRVFSFLRAERPEGLYDRIANIIGEMAHKAQQESVLLLIENEPASNVGNCADLAAFLPKVPEKLLGFNWDPRNALSTHETPFPDGYRILPKSRMRNAQIKGHDMLDPDRPLDWATIFAAVDADGFAGQIGLETHYFDGTKLERSHLAMDKIVKLADANERRAAVS